MEKPFTRTSEEADKLLTLAKEKGVVLTVYQSTYTTDRPNLSTDKSQKIDAGMVIS